MLLRLDCGSVLFSSESYCNVPYAETYGLFGKFIVFNTCLIRLPQNEMYCSDDQRLFQREFDTDYQQKIGRINWYAKCPFNGIYISWE